MCKYYKTSRLHPAPSWPAAAEWISISEVMAFVLLIYAACVRWEGEHYTSAAQISGDSREEQSRSPLYERINWTQETENCGAFYGVLCCVPWSHSTLHFTTTWFNCAAFYEQRQDARTVFLLDFLWDLMRINLISTATTAAKDEQVILVTFISTFSKASPRCLVHFYEFK